ncbi:MAG: carbohydrate ABC transporter permease [Oscillospiraceae bacterium]|nr:carbohydrate ABC transporter permease [Oscillospiraceae bacterium]
MIINKKKNKGPAKDASEKFVTGLAVVVSVLMILICLLPCIHVLATSVSSGNAEVAGRVGLWPVDFQLDGIKTIVVGTNFMKSLGNSLYVTIVGTLISLTITTMFAYAMSKTHLKGRKLLTIMCIIAMVFSGGMVPEYIVMKKLGLMNTFWSLILPRGMTIFNMLLIKNYFEGLPESVMESANIDGAGDFRTLVSIVLPMSTPVIATTGLLYAVAYWNNYLHPVLYINDPAKRTLQVFLRDLLADVATVTEQLERSPETAGLVSAGVITAGITVMGTIPILLLYPFVQRFLVQGITIGSEKG